MIARLAFCLIALAVSTYCSVLYRDEYGNLIRYRGRSDQLDVYNKFQDTVRGHRMNELLNKQRDAVEERFPARRRDFVERRRPFKDSNFAYRNIDVPRFEDPEDERKFEEKHDSLKDLDSFRKEFEGESSKKDEVKPAPTKKDEAEPVKKDEPKPAEVKKDEPKPVEAKKDVPKPVEAKKDEPKPVEAKKDVPKPAEAKKDEVKPEETKKNEAVPVKKDEPKAEIKEDEKKTKYADSLFDDEDEKKDVKDTKKSGAEEGKQILSEKKDSEEKKTAEVIKVSEDASPKEDRSKKVESLMTKDMETVKKALAIENEETPFKDNRYNKDLDYRRFREAFKRRDEARRMRHRFNDYNFDNERKEHLYQNDRAPYNNRFEDSMFQQQRQQRFRDMMAQRRRAQFEDAPKRRPFRFEENNDFEQRKHPSYERFESKDYQQI